MNKQDLHTIDHDWYNRLHRLREVWQNESETKARRYKAKKLWAAMGARLMMFSRLLDSQRATPDFAPGGIGVNDSGDIVCSSSEAI